MQTIVTIVASLQLIACAGLIFGAVVAGWRLGERYSLFH
jgi:hypothetical protein